MSLDQIRDAATASDFDSLEKQDDWLRAAVGDHRMLLTEAIAATRWAVKRSPMSGHGYLYLSKLRFLDPSLPPDETLQEQAMRLRPHNASILFAVGQNALFRGDYATMFKLWRRAYHLDPKINEMIVQSLAPKMKANVFIEQFRPDRDQTFALCSFYEEKGSAGQAQVVASHYVDDIWAHAAEERSPIAWQRAYTLAVQIDDPRSIRTAHRAVQLDKSNYAMRRRLAMELVAHSDWEGALTNLMWCVKRNGADREVREKLKLARRKLREHNAVDRR